MENRTGYLKGYKDLLHEIFNDPEHPQVLADMEAWLASYKESLND